MARASAVKAAAKKLVATRRSAPNPPAKKAKPASTEPRAAADLQIGGRLRHARVLAGIRMRELAELVGCTESMVSKIENGHVVPSLPMLQRLVEALDRDLTSFFGADPNAPGVVQRAGQRPRGPPHPIPDGPGVT